MPPHHPLIQEYTWEEMLIEFVADAIEDERIEVGVGGRPVKKLMHKGIEVVQTGSKIFDDLELEWADQDVGEDDEEFEFLPPEDEDEIPDGADLLETIGEQMRKQNAG